MNEAKIPVAGDVIGGKYVVVRQLGEGGMGVVFEAMHAKLKQGVAIKMLLPAILANRQAVDRFEREARAAAQLKSPHVARVLDVDTLPNGLPYMVMELLEGCDLQEELHARGRIPCEEAVGYVRQACSAMIEAHQVGIVHRDLKPANLFLANVGGQRTVKVLDFGISKMVEEGELSVTSTQTSLGTPLYMSPEQVRSSKHVDAQTDVWSLGVILYELVTGELPFLGESVAAVAASITADAPIPPRTREPSIPESLEHTILTALSKNKDGRYPSALALSNALGGVEDTLPAAGEVAFSARPREEVSRPSRDVRVAPASGTAADPSAATIASASSLATTKTAGEWTTKQTEAPATRSRTTALVVASGAAACAIAAGALLLLRTPSVAIPADASSSRPSAEPVQAPAPPASVAASAPAPAASTAPDASAAVSAAPSARLPGLRPGAKAAVSPPADTPPPKPASTKVDRGF